MASYKTPNGTIVEESILREKYGSRFDELVSNGTFTLEEEEVVKKKDSDFPVQEEVTESITELETPDTSLDSSEEVVDLEEPEAIPDPVDTESKVLSDLQINPEEFNSWKEENLRPESKAYDFFKNILLTDEGEQFEDEEKIQKQVSSYLAQKLNKNLELIDESDEFSRKSLIEQNKKDSQTLLDNLKSYNKEAVLDEKEDRRKLLERQSKGLLTRGLSTGLDLLKSGANAAVQYSMGTAAALFSEADALLTSAGADKKGALAGISEAFLDAGQAWDLDLGQVKRSAFTQGKEVMYGGKEYIVSDTGVVYDAETNIRVDDIIPESDVIQIAKKAALIEDDVTNVDLGSSLSGIGSTLVNLYGLIKSGKGVSKALGVGPKLGMGIASFASSVADNMASVKDDLMAQGVSETEANDKAVVFGNAIATLDGLFSGLAGSNEKLLGSTKIVKDALFDLAKKKGKDFSKEQLKSKAKDLIKENAKELFIEEIPVLLSEKGINSVINYAAGVDARSGIEDLKRADLYETTLLTVGATTGIGSKKLLTNNQRNDIVRQLSQNTDGLEKAGAKLVDDGLLTKDEAAKAINEVKAMEYAEAKTSGAVKITENMLEAAALITKKEQLTKEKEQTDPSLVGDIDNRIASINKQLEQIKAKDDADVRDIIKNEKDAIQEQETGDILDAKPAESVQEVEEEVREPSIETEEKVTEKEVSDRKSRIDSKPKIFGDFHTDSKLPYGKAEIYDITSPDNKGVQTAQYNNPNTGTLDVIISSSGTSTNFVGFTRVYEGGKPTNKFTAKMESTGDAFKNMITSAESTLPPGSEVVETTSISLGGINAYEKSKILKPKLDSDGNVVTNPTKYSSATKESVAEKGTGAYNPFESSNQKEIDAEIIKIKEANPDINVRVEEVERKGPKIPPAPPGSKPRVTKKNIIIDLPVYETTKKSEQLESETTVEETEVVKEEVIDDKTKVETPVEDADIVLPTGNKFKDAITRFKKTYLTARKFLPKVWYNIIQNKTAQVQGDVDELSNLNRDYDKAINKIKDKNERQATEEAAQKLLAGEEVEVNEEVRDIVTQMRVMIDSFSRKLLNDPTISKKDKEKIKANLGNYLNRAYKIYDNNNWRGQVEMGLQNDILNSAKDYLRGQIKRETPGLSEAEVENKVDVAVDEILRGKEGSKWLFGTDVQGKNLKILTKKKKIPLQIRALMGEYTDVAQSFAKTIINLSSLTNTSQMLRDLTSVGLQTGILKTKDQRTPEFNYQIKGDGSKAFEEIAGLYTTKEIADQFNEMTDPKSVNPALATWYRIVSLNKYGKTILSPQTHAVNFFSNVGFAAVNGYGNVQELSKAYEAFRNLTRGKKFNRELYNKYIRLGLIDKSVGLSEARELFSDETFESAILRNIDKKGNNLLSKINSKLKKGFKKGFENPYQAEDDFWKIYAFENEKIRYSNALYNKKPSDLTETELSEVEKIAAENVKKVLPSYDQIPDGIKKLRAIPIVGSFVSFQYESYRTALNTIKLGMSELKDPKLRSAGAKRIGGSITYVGARNALLGFFGKTAGIGISGLIGALKPGSDEEDDEKEKKILMKRYLFEWQKNSDILPLDIKDGKFSFIDISGSDPHGAINKTINGMTDAESVSDAAITFFTESTIKPFLGGEMTAILLAEVLSNKTSKGGQIYRDGDPDDVKYEKQVDHIVKQVSPSAWRQYNKIIESDEKLSTAGQMAVGLKKYNLDINKQFGYKASSFKYDGPAKTKYAYKKAYNEAVENNASQEELNDIYENYKEEYDERYNDFYLDYISARDVFGVDVGKLAKTMTDIGVSKSKIRQIAYGNLPTLPKNPNLKTKKSSSLKVTGF
jgi:hypothetical protein